MSNNYIFIKVCPRCKKQHSKLGTFCSRKCANSRIQTEEKKKKISESVKKYWKNISTEEMGKRRKNCKNHMTSYWERFHDDIIFENLTSHGGRRNFIIKEQKYKCAKCNLEKWLGQSITFELDHIDGNKNNNNRHNLQALCPNCHSQTPTWRGRKNTKNMLL